MQQWNNLEVSLWKFVASKSHEPAIELAEKLVDLSPYDNAKVFFGSSGSDANDTQIKLFGTSIMLLKNQEEKISF